MVRAILEGRKTQTRRIIKEQPYSEGMRSYGESWAWRAKEKGIGWFSGVTAEQIKAPCGLIKSLRSPYGEPGDRLWVRECFGITEGEGQIVYKTAPNYSPVDVCPVDKWKSSIHMPRWASRITLEITGVRVERLQDISEEDALAEGIYRVKIGSGYPDLFAPDETSWQEAVEQQQQTYETAKDAFVALWESIHGPGSWEANPFVWVLEFKRPGA